MYRSEFSDVDYLDDLNVVLVKWKKFCRQDDYRNTLLYAIDIMKKHTKCNFVADTRDGFENEEADTQWVFDVFIPQTALTTCKAIFFIIDSDNSLKEELEGHSSELGKKFDVHYCFGLDDVKKILEAEYRSFTMDSENLHRLRNRAYYFMNELNNHMILKKYWDSLSLVMKGSTARGYSDKYSDIDFVIFTDQSTEKDIITDYISNGLSDRKDSVFLPLNNWEGHYNTDTYENIETHFKNKNMIKVWELSNVMVLHDSGGKYEETIRKNKDELFAGIDSLIKRKYFDIRLHLDWIRHPLKRADINSAIQYASHLQRYCCHMMYLLDNQSYPNEKWLFYYLKDTGISDNLYLKIISYSNVICESPTIKPDLELSEYGLYNKMREIIEDIINILKIRYGCEKWIDEWYLYAE